MLRITDKTLSCLDDYDAKPGQLRALCELLLELGVDYTELSVNAYEKIGHLPAEGKYILKIEDVPQSSEYPEFDRYVCRHSGYPASVEFLTEIQVNDISEIHFLRQYKNLENVRIVGLDDIMCHDYQMAFEQIHRNIPGKIELCPEDRYSCATAVAVEWALFGGRDLTASFAGIGGCAPLEEVLMALRLELRHKPNRNYSVFPKIRKLFEEITGAKIPAHKAVIGSNIFDVEAGIHADGISKDPGIYEPFKPELVGSRRCLVLGKHSGKAAVILKLKELGIQVNPEDITRLLSRIKVESIKKQGSLSDEDFLKLLHNMKTGGESGERQKISG